MKVYVVTSGSYSDFGLEGIFSSREKAEQFAAEFDKLDRTNEVEEWEVDERQGMVAKPYWEVHMQKESGGVEKMKEGERLRLVAQNVRNERPGTYHKRNIFTGFREEYVWVISYVSMDHAVKLAAETRQAMLRGDYSGVEE